MSDDIPTRDEIVKSSIITVILTSIFLILGVLFWAGSAPGVTSFVTTIDAINPFITVLLEVLFMFLSFVFLTVTIVNLRLYVTQIRAGWLEIFILLIVMTIFSWLMFDGNVAGASFALSLGFVVYLYLLQE
ncbi:MAG: hypothetical protein ACXADL_14475 [Candidatus Thorarchaeota archaeon]